MSTAIEIQKRPSCQTKGELRILRQQGWIPSVLYGNNAEPIKLSVFQKTFLKELQNPGINTRVFNLGTFGLALVKEMQFPPTKDTPIHIDWMRLGDRVTVSIPLRFINEDRSPGLKKGGILNVIHYSLNVSVSSHHIPHDLPIDLTGVEIGETLHIKDLNLAEDIRLIGMNSDESIVSVVAPSGLVDSLAAAAK
jgi:large subunit ribosomal protein L25